VQIQVNLDAQAAILLVAALGLSGDLETAGKAVGKLAGLAGSIAHGVLASLAVAFRTGGGGGTGWERRQVS
jgi:hypothetical protein